jgi:catechol 2,3-dioxygenase-like lactoylglutathione lyase family enzyme
MPVEVIGIDHLYLAVRSLERSEAFYDRVMLQVLGYRKGRSAIAGEPHAHYFNRQFGFSLRPARAQTPEHDPYAPGIHHFCFRVLDARSVDRAAAELRALGIGATAPRFSPEYALFALDILACPDCGGRLRLLATIEDRAVVEKILTHPGLPADPPQPSAARAPAWLPGVRAAADHADHAGRSVG